MKKLLIIVSFLISFSSQAIANDIKISTSTNEYLGKTLDIGAMKWTLDSGTPIYRAYMFMSDEYQIKTFMLLYTEKQLDQLISDLHVAKQELIKIKANY